MIWEEYDKVRENLGVYAEKVANDDKAVLLIQRGEEPDIVLMSRNHYTLLKAQLKDLERVKKVLDALEEYTSYRKEERERIAKQPPVENRIGIANGMFEIPEEFFGKWDEEIAEQFGEAV